MIVTCKKPIIENGQVTPNDESIKGGETYSVSCNYGYTLPSGTSMMMCGFDGQFIEQPTCTG